MNNLITNEYTAVVYDRTFRITAERLVNKCGVRADLKGARCLVDAVILYGTEVCTGFCEIYRIIGELRKINAKSVMREISYAITQAFDIQTRLSELVGITIKPIDIHNGLVIAYLGRLFKDPKLCIYD